MLNLQTFDWSRAALAALLFAVLIPLSACGGLASQGDEGGSGGEDERAASEPAEGTEPENAGSEATQPEGTQPESAEAEQQAAEREDAAAPAEDGAVDEDEYQERLQAASERATPDPENLQGAPEMKKWNDPAGDDAPDTTQFFNTGSSAGDIPAVKPFNFGRDPGGPDDKTLYLTVPSIGLEDVPIYDSVEEEKLTESAVHVPATGFPWQEGANTFIAGHRIGYPGTGSDRVFYDLDELTGGEEVILRDADGGEYVYEITSQVVVGPMDTEVMNPEPDKSVVSLQTCTLPDYQDRIVVQGDLVSSSPA